MPGLATRVCHGANSRAALEALTHDRLLARSVPKYTPTTDIPGRIHFSVASAVTGQTLCHCQCTTVPQCVYGPGRVFSGLDPAYAVKDPIDGCVNQRPETGTGIVTLACPRSLTHATACDLATVIYSAHRNVLLSPYQSLPCRKTFVFYLALTVKHFQNSQKVAQGGFFFGLLSSEIAHFTLVFGHTGVAFLPDIVSSEALLLGLFL